ncbi:MAG: hypothetical protein Q9225_004172 [Loekoesia sp. 1 TL-2023]
MSTFQALTTTFNAGSIEDPMELYSELENRPTVDDNIDIDLDLTTDPPENIDDDEMVEDPEVDVEDATHSNMEPVHDEQMIDETGEDDGVPHETIDNIYSEHDEDLDDVGFVEPSDEPEENLDITEQFPQLEHSSHNIVSQDITKQVDEDHKHFDHQTHSILDPDVNDSPGETQDLAGQDQVPEAPLVQASSVSFADPASAPHIVSGDDMFPSRNQVKEFTHETLSPSDRAPPSSQKLQDTVGEPQVIELETKSYQDHSDTFLMEPSSVFSKSNGNRERAESIAADNFSGITKHEPQSLESDTGPPRDAAEAPNSYENTSKLQVINQDDADVPETDVADDSHEHSDEPVVSELNHDQGVDTSQGAPYLHAVVVTYEESEMFLFPPAAEEQDDNQTYFLTNEALAAEPIQNLLKACRNVLEGNISEQEELEINIDALGVRICESTVDAASITLTHILDIYLQLHYHDGNDAPPPMTLTLTTNVRFSHRLDFLSNFVAEGKGLSQLEGEDTSILNGSPELAEEPRMTEAVGQPTPANHSSNANEFPINETHDQHSQSIEESAAHVSAEGPHDELNFSSSSENRISTNNMEPTEQDTLANGTKLNHDTLSASGEAATTTNPISTIPSPAKDSNELATQLLHEADAFQGDAENEEQEDDIDYEEDDNPNEDSSAGSSTVQGDDILAVKEGLDVLNQKRARDGKAVLAQELAEPKSDQEPEIEDFITYESDEENGHDNPSDTLLRDTEDVESESRRVLRSESVASSDAKATSFRSVVQNNEADAETLPGQTSDTYAPSRKVSNSNYERTNHDEGGGLDEEATKNEAWNPEEYDGNNQGGMLSFPTSQKVHHNVDQDNNTLSSSILSNTDAENWKHTAQSSIQPAEDEDEITFDDEIEDETVTKDPVDVSTDYASEHAASLSPGSLKRGRAYDDIADPNDTQDTKRVRSG